ncbi:MAG: hypothetical protein L0Y50_07105 [Beijerinckiaceae bacterium]|nr:hypothetical protein [Beijerinckiaceae bacterium]MCI0736025.1 hypothetical protein [Beijerinckiaceae bacterium]
MTASDLKDAVKHGGGEAIFKPVQREALTSSTKVRAFEITNAKGRAARATIADFLQLNGVVHVTNKVPMP